MRDEEGIQILRNYVRLEFCSHIFYLPCIPSNICFKANTLSIDMADMEEHVLVDGIQCYYCLIYDAGNDTLSTWLKDFTIDGLICPELTYLTFKISDREFSFSKHDPRTVVPKRDYTELVSVFIDEHKDLNEKVVKFLKEHPETLEKAPIHEWLDLSNQIYSYKEYNSIDVENDFLQSIAESLI